MTGNAHVTKGLAQWICSESSDRLPAVVREKTVDVIYDAVGAMVACSTLPEVRAIVDLIELQGGQPECTITGLQALTPENLPFSLYSDVHLKPSI